MDDHLLACEEDATRVAMLALGEDGRRDISSLVSIGATAEGRGTIEVRSSLVVAGLTWAEAVLEAVGLRKPRWNYLPGETAPTGSVLAVLDGNLRALLRAERPMLNLLQRASGIATVTADYVKATTGTNCRILHTRKTTPGLRRFEIAAALAGGAAPHRTGLADVVMIKDNHWAGLKAQGRTLTDALAEASALGVESLQVEVEELEQLKQACAAGATRLLIDNQSAETCGQWAALARAISPTIEIEATGGITLADIPGYAASGVDFISVGALTHSVPAADLGLEIHH